LGIGNLVIVDRDQIEESNLSRSVLFRATDQGQPKAVVAARSAKAIYPKMHISVRAANVLSDIGLGYFRWADVVVGALDNREARVFVNQACAQVGRPWIDGGIEVLNGIVRGFAPPDSACYECTMSQADWDVLSRRRSCGMLARRAIERGGVPTTPTTASVIGAIQAQEVVKKLHGLETLRGSGFVFEGLTHHSFTVGYPISPDCPWHEPPPAIERTEFFDSIPMSEMREFAKSRLGGLDAIDLSREILQSLQCPGCGGSTDLFKPVEAVSEEDAICAQCGAQRVPNFLHSIPENSPLWDRTAKELGIPAWDVVWARKGSSVLGLELGGDSSACLSPIVKKGAESP
jgi:molybdopterin/thiamine biosynthesis adenylyltransferase